jgi:hypothetical protein
MENTIQAEQFRQAVLIVFEEVFAQVHGILLDKGTSLFETLAGISAAQASIPVGGRCATLAAQVAHVNFYLEVLERFLHGDRTPADWGEVWRSVGAVDAAQWQALQAQLHATYPRLRELIETYPDWSAEDAMGAAIGLVAHSAYHLGEIRQALCLLG